MSATSTWDTASLSHCEHAQQEMRCRTIAGGRQRAEMQCLTCGSGVKAVRFVGPLGSLPPFDEKLREAYWQAVRDRVSERAAAREEKEAQKSAAWWAGYDEYRATPKWQELRRRVLARSGGRCEAQMLGCTGIASQVHHKNYEHVGDEPIFDLAAICKQCHDRITERDRSGAVPWL